MALDLQLILDIRKLEPTAVLAKLYDTHPQILGKSNAIYRLKSTSRTFGFHAAGAEFMYAHVSLWDHSLLALRNCVTDAADAWRWCKPYSVERCFRQAFAFDNIYLNSQTMDDPAWFEGKQLPLPDLPTVRDRFGRTVLDTSRNPGRRVIRDGYIEVVSALMWLGRPFWKLSGASRKRVLAQSWLKCRELPNDVLQIQAWDAPFTSAEGEQGEIQVRLRELLFPDHAPLDEAVQEADRKKPKLDLAAMLRKAVTEVDRELAGKPRKGAKSKKKNRKK
jgi:hypothetical protein